MSTAAIVVTAVLGVLVLATWLSPGRGDAWERIHLLAGLAGLIVWAAFLSFPDDSMFASDMAGIIGLFFLWWIAIAGIAMLIVAPPDSGRRSRATVRHRTPGSIVLHVGSLVAVVILTYAYMTAAV